MQDQDRNDVTEKKLRELEDYVRAYDKGFDQGCFIGGLATLLVVMIVSIIMYYLL